MSAARVLVIGLDATDKDIVLRMIGEGRLPTLASLGRNGAMAETVNPFGLYIGALWTSFATGVSPARHGRHGPRQIVPGTYEAQELVAAEAQHPPFWRAVGEAGRKVLVVDVPHTHPIPGLPGIQVSEWGAHDPAQGFATWPPELATELTARFGRHPVHPSSEQECDAADRTPDDYVALRDALIDGVERKAALCCDLLDRGGWDLFLTVFCESHCANHQCWHLRDPTHPRHDPVAFRKVGDVLEQVYIALDAAVARVLARVGDDATVLVLASHGAGPHYDASFLLDRILRRLERPTLAIHRRVARSVSGFAWRRGPARYRVRHPRRWDRLWRGFEELPPLDPGTRRYFKIDNNEPFGGIRINLVGREPRGLVRPGEEFDACCAELAVRLLEIVNLETGRPLARRVIRTADVYRGPHLDMLPDVLVEWDWEAPVRSVWSAWLGRIDAEDPGVRTGDHRPGGLLVARGPGIRPGWLPPVDVTDLAPTVAALLDVPLDDVDGRAVPGLVGHAAEPAST